MALSSFFLCDVVSIEGPYPLLLEDNVRVVRSLFVCCKSLSFIIF